MTNKPWEDAKIYQPDAYDLVQVLFDNGKEQVAWWCGSDWDAGRKLRGDKVVKWKKLEQGKI